MPAVNCKPTQTTEGISLMTNKIRQLQRSVDTLSKGLQQHEQNMDAKYHSLPAVQAEALRQPVPLLCGRPGGASPTRPLSSHGMKAGNQ